MRITLNVAPTENGCIVGSTPGASQSHVLTTKVLKYVVIASNISLKVVDMFFGYLNVVHLGDVTLNVGWIWYAGTSSALCFMFLNSIVTSSEQLRLLKRWHIIATILFFTLLLLAPTFPPFPNALTPALLNLARPFFCALAFCRYTMLYISKQTRFSLVMSFAFLLLGVGFAMITPQLLAPDLVLVTVMGAILRILGYSTLLFAYVGTK